MATTHNLAFEVAEDPISSLMGNGFQRFRVGTCEGLWRATYNTYDILAISNNVPGNGHFEDVLQWFENSCRRDKKKLRIMEVWNKDFKNHLITKRGFRIEKGDNVIKKVK